MLKYVRATYLVLIIGSLIGGPWAYLLYRDWTARNFHVVEPGVLYRSGQVPVPAFERMVHDYGIRTVICLRENDTDDVEAEKKYCQRWGIHHICIPPRAWWAPKGPAPAEQGLATFREALNNPANHPVLVHCFAGLHRTGAFCAVYRMEYQGWTSADAIAEMKRIGYRNIDDEWDVLGFLQNYRAGERGVVRTVSRRN